MTECSAKAILVEFYEKESHYLSEAGGDFSIVADLIHPSCVMHQAESLPYGGEWKGPSGFKAWMEAFGMAWSSLKVVKSEMFDFGDVVISKISVEAIARSTGTSVAFDVMQYVRAADGKLIEFRPFYWDIPKLLDALGE